VANKNITVRKNKTDKERNPRRMRWAGHVAHIRESRGLYRFWWRNRRERDHYEDPGVDGRIIL